MNPKVWEDTLLVNEWIPNYEELGLTLEAAVGIAEKCEEIQEQDPEASYDEIITYVSGLSIYRDNQR